ncbi:MAG: diacylglycerol kinase [Candidatus Magasanikbacteria bacterium CG11_big_fil_rev_8_21_14_0_20_39_34]|uniref:Dihydrofolate reductase n=1 Tax=Candidatus Magasanikbacteria bacterium CG11_big_fil_rev_8_21_14_0_20_39_34 TaxID=1974653 RepID=A0A2H0N698_9BACT|nr:MAG: diacylglycerol kinase [Candidatus Magasanikbacteria bacterium CG11_big_fil_rev_8_21_14_0_20_39_34]
MITLIAAVSENFCIGKNGELPWNIPEDLKHFKRLTEGHVVIMGRKTWESIPEKFRPLPKRKNVVITRQTNYPVPEGVEVFSNLEEALLAFSQQSVFIIGGEQIYSATIEKADQLEITHIQKTIPDGDAFFPAIDSNLWENVSEETHENFSFVTYKRK